MARAYVVLAVVGIGVELDDVLGDGEMAAPLDAAVAVAVVVVTLVTVVAMLAMPMTPTLAAVGGAMRI